MKNTPGDLATLTLAQRKKIIDGLKDTEEINSVIKSAPPAQQSQLADYALQALQRGDGSQYRGCKPMRWLALMLVVLVVGAACRRAPSVSVTWVPGNPDGLRISADHRMLLRSWADHFDVVDASRQVVTRSEPGQRAIGVPDDRGQVVVLRPGGEVTGRDRKPLTSLPVPADAVLVDVADGDTCAVLWHSASRVDELEVAAFSCSIPGSPVLKTLEGSQWLATASSGHLILAGKHADAWALTALDTKLETIATTAIPGAPVAIASGGEAGQVLVAIAGADRLHPPRFFVTTASSNTLSELLSEQGPRSVAAGCEVTALSPSGRNAWVAACVQRDHTKHALFSYVVRLDASKLLAVSDALVDAGESTSWITSIVSDERGRFLVAGVKSGDHDLPKHSN